MTHFAMPVSSYMTSPVCAVLPTDDLEVVQQELVSLGVSALAVTDERGHLVGVVTRTDLLHVGRRQAGSGHKAALLTLPKKPVSEVMEPDVISVKPDSAVSDAAKAMVRHRVHRVFVEDGNRLLGVLSTRDLMNAIDDKRMNEPIGAFMSSPVFSIDFDEPVSLAVERLEKAHVSGLVVVEEQWPIGVFTQIEALESRDAPRGTPVEEVRSAAMLCLDLDTPMHRAAAQAAAMDVRRVIAVRERRMEGILTGLDFAKAAAQ